ncbi:hypothetical protein [Ralstonia sp. ASV6]|uniref:hypothetical protein n=1 Tax=Ralstonia sp. ASV6 TaxID=2795124 RepID=UPI0018EA64BD|nr:hypothetical protein [Ralstonia sp. ASV6]
MKIEYPAKIFGQARSEGDVHVRCQGAISVPLELIVTAAPGLASVTNCDGFSLCFGRSLPVRAAAFGLGFLDCLLR